MNRTFRTVWLSVGATTYCGLLLLGLSDFGAEIALRLLLGGSILWVVVGVIARVHGETS